METLQGNKIIAEYDGVYKDNYGRFFKNHRYVSDDESGFQYHKSWDWLIPVLRKISEKDDIYKAGVASIMSKHNYDIEPIWKITVEHITLSNKK